MIRYRFLCLTMLLAAVGCGHAENSLLLMEQLPDVASITIRGNERFSDGTIKGLMAVREGSWNPFREHKFRKGQFQTDLNAILTFYRRHGYLQAQITDQQVRQAGDEVHITIQIKEGVPVTAKHVTIQGTETLDPDELQEKLTAKPEEPLDPFRLQDDRRVLMATLAELGYWEASVDVNVQFFGNQALVFYRIREGKPVTLRELTVGGVNEVDENLVRRDISVKVGEVLKRDELIKSQIRLIQSGYFSDARWDTTGLDPLKHEVSVHFRVRERKLNWMETGIGVSSQERIRFTGEWGTRNLLRSGMRFAVVSRTDLDVTDRLPSLLDEHRTDLILNRTHLLGTQWEGQPNAFFLHDREVIDDLVAAGMDGDYTQNIVGVGASARRRFGDLRNQLVISLENRWVNSNASDEARNSDPQLVDHQTRLLSGRLARDTRNGFFNPTQGSYQNGLVSFAGGVLGGNSSFFKGVASISNFQSLRRGSWVVATRLQIGHILPSTEETTAAAIPIEDRFLLGGANTVRGYSQDELDGSDPAEGQEGGLTKLLFGSELRFPMLWKFGGVVFLDAGNVWQDHETFGLRRLLPRLDRKDVKELDVRYSLGLGLRFNTPVGPVRLDYARKVNLPLEEHGKDRWHVALGHAF